MSYVAKSGRKGRSWQEIINYLTREKNRRGAENKQRIALATAKSLLKEVLLSGVLRKISFSEDAATSYVLASLVQSKSGVAKTRKEAKSSVETQEHRWATILDEMHLQLDIRDVQSKRIRHVFWRQKIRNISDDHVEFLYGRLFSNEPHTMKEWNLVTYVIQDGVMTPLNPIPLAYSGETSFNYKSRLPKLLDKGKSVLSILSHDDKDLAMYYDLTDVPYTKKLTFDLIKVRTNTESLHCQVRARRTEEGDYLPQVGKRVIVTDMLSGKKTYALRLIVNDPPVERDLHYKYQN